jgi:hypothetical protein
MEDVIEERAITKLCGYVLCSKPLTVIINQRYHISLKSKKVYDVTKRKNFCSSSCFGASNYLLQQVLTSPLWLRDKEEIPKFRIFCQDNSKSVSHGEELDISLIDRLKDEVQLIKDTNISTNEIQSDESVDNISEYVNDNVFEATTNISEDRKDLVKNIKIPMLFNTMKVCNELESDTEKKDIPNVEQTGGISIYSESKCDKLDDCEKPKCFEEQIENTKKSESCIIQDNDSKVNLQNTHNLESKGVTNSAPRPAKILQTNIKKFTETLTNDKLHKQHKNKKSKHKKTEEQGKEKVCFTINLAARVEESFRDWVTDETINFLFGDNSSKKKTLADIERQDKYSILCKKLNKLQFQDHQEDSEVAKPILKPTPHFTDLQEEAQKLDLKVKSITFFKFQSFFCSI